MAKRMPGTTTAQPHRQILTPSDLGDLLRDVRKESGLTQREAAGLLRLLVERGVPVASFIPIKETLEDVYLRAGVRQVD